MPLTLSLPSDEQARIETRGLAVIDEAQALVIRTPEAFERAGVLLREVIVPLKQEIQGLFRPRIAQANALHKGLVADEHRYLKPVEEAERILKQGRTRFKEEEEARRREAETAVQRERERLEAEARARQEMEATRLKAEAEEARLNEALAAEAKGDVILADRLLAEPLPNIAPSPIVVFTPPTDAPPLDGTFREQWRAEVHDLDAVIRAAAQGHPGARAILQINQAAVNAQARALKAALAIPGVKAVRDLIEAVRA